MASDSTSEEEYRSLLPTTQFRAVITALGPASLLAALLYYFGWVRTNEVYKYLGIDQSILGFNTQDYVLRSTTGVFWPAIWILAGLIALLSTLPLVRAVRSWRYGQTVVQLTIGGLLIAGVAAIVIAIVDYRNGAPHQGALEAKQYWAPIIGTLGVTLLVVAVRVLAIAHPKSLPQTSSNERGLIAALVLGVIVLGLFWSVGEAAATRGRHQVIRATQRLQSQPGVEVYSETPLFLEGPGVVVEELSYAGTTMFRYSGLRYITNSGGYLVLLPCGWSTGTFPRAFLITDSDLRIDVVQPGGNTACSFGERGGR